MSRVSPGVGNEESEDGPVNEVTTNRSTPTGLLTPDPSPVRPQKRKREEVSDDVKPKVEQPSSPSPAKRAKATEKTEKENVKIKQEPDLLQDEFASGKAVKKATGSSLKAVLNATKPAKVKREE